MNETELLELIKSYGFEDNQVVTALCREVERTTRHAYFSLIQNANNAASQVTITARQLDKFIWDAEHPPKPRKKSE